MLMFMFYILIPLETGILPTPCTKITLFYFSLILVTCPTCYYLLYQFSVSLLSRLVLGPREFSWNFIHDEN